LKDFFGLRESTERLLGEDQLAVEDDLELSTHSLDEYDVDLAVLLDLGRQTGGPREIVSRDAVGDLDLLHGFPP